MESTTITSKVLCDLSEEGQQNVIYDHVNFKNNTSTAVDEVLDYNYSWSCANEERTLTGNGVPNHAVSGGQFASKISSQSVEKTFSLNPEKTSAITNLREPGYALNSIKFEPATAGTCPDQAENDTTCDYGAGRDTWRMVALPGETSPWIFDFGVDKSNAHVQPTGAYHYHGIPEDLLLNINSSSTTTMTLAGWAADGFPIYARYGYTNPNDSSSTLKVIKSSYKLKTTADDNRPSTDLIEMGHFEQDWEYIEESGDLDACNGRDGVTPEFPDGIYHYYMTDNYPFIQRCVMGTSESEKPPGGGGPPDGRPPGGGPPGGGPPGGG
jgi:hypothetical protein